MVLLVVLLVVVLLVVVLLVVVLLVVVLLVVVPVVSSGSSCMTRGMTMTLKGSHVGGYGETGG